MIALKNLGLAITLTLAGFAIASAGAWSNKSMCMKGYSYLDPANNASKPDTPLRYLGMRGFLPRRFESGLNEIYRGSPPDSYVTFDFTSKEFKPAEYAANYCIEAIECDRDIEAELKAAYRASRDKVHIRYRRQVPMEGDFFDKTLMDVGFKTPDGELVHLPKEFMLAVMAHNSGGNIDKTQLLEDRAGLFGVPTHEPVYLRSGVWMTTKPGYVEGVRDPALSKDAAKIDYRSAYHPNHNLGVFLSRMSIFWSTLSKQLPGFKSLPQEDKLRLLALGHEIDYDTFVISIWKYGAFVAALSQNSCEEFDGSPIRLEHGPAAAKPCHPEAFPPTPKNLMLIGLQGSGTSYSDEYARFIAPLMDRLAQDNSVMKTEGEDPFIIMRGLTKEKMIGQVQRCLKD